jgi:hypothetical protein
VHISFHNSSPDFSGWKFGKSSVVRKIFGAIWFIG